MIIRFPDKTAVQQVGDFHDWTMVYVQVRGDGAVRLGQSSSELSQVGPGGHSQGLSFLPSDRTQQLYWRGPLYAMGDIDGAVADFQFVS